jgi:hypothetical protein
MLKHIIYIFYRERQRETERDGKRTDGAVLLKIKERRREKKTLV